MSRISLILSLALMVLPGLLTSCGLSVATPTPLPTATASKTRTSTPTGAVDLAPFTKMAQSGGCNDIRNRLYLIDNQVVFWDIAGNCADASYAQMLYGGTPDQVLCVSHDSIAGPVKNCRDARYQAMFDAIIANVSKTDLGLGPQHMVQSISF